MQTNNMFNQSVFTRSVLVKRSALSLAMVVGIAFTGFGNAADEPALESEQDKLSYGLGVLISENLKQQNFEDLNYDLVFKAIQQNTDGEAQMTLEEARASLQDYQRRQQEEKAEVAKQAGKAYLDENAKREGVNVTDSGLQYEEVTAAEGDKPGIDDTVKVHYVGTLEDGTEFDSSVARGEPAQFPLKGVIPGWTEGLQLMSVGSKYRFVIPSDLAYGDRGAGPKIGPGATLIFDVELLEIVK